MKEDVFYLNDRIIIRLWTKSGMRKKVEKVSIGYTGGLYDAKVMYYCKPRKTGKTKLARYISKNFTGKGVSIFVKVLEHKTVDPTRISFLESNFVEATVGSLVDLSQLSVLRRFGLVVVDDIHFLPEKAVRRLVTEVKKSDLLPQLVCFGTSADYEGDRYSGSSALVEIADEVIYDKSCCYACGQDGETSFTKRVFDFESNPDDEDCVIDDDDVTTFVDMNLCLDCEEYDGDYIEEIGSTVMDVINSIKKEIRTRMRMRMRIYVCSEICTIIEKVV